LIGDHSYIQYHLEYLGRDGASQYLLIPAYILTFAKYYIYSLACGKSKSLFWAAFFLTLTVALFGRVRFEIISAIVFFAILGNYNKFLIISKYFAIILAVASPLIMYFLLIKRDYVGPLELSLIGAAIFSEVYEAWNSGRLFEGVRTSMESFYTFDIYNRVIMDGFISPDNGFFRLFYTLIPREYWPEKPLPMQIELAKAYNQSSYSNGGGVFASIYGDAYANAGFVGVVIFPFLTGLLIGRAYKNTRADPSWRNIGFYALIVTYLINAYRGYFSDMAWQVVLLYICWYFFGKFPFYAAKIFPRPKN
jgi:hypothetical protein